MVSIIRSAQIDSAHYTLVLPGADVSLKTVEKRSFTPKSSSSSSANVVEESASAVPVNSLENEAEGNTKMPPNNPNAEKANAELQELKEKLKQTEKLLEAAKHQLDARINEHKDKAYEDGFEAGKEEGRAVGRAEFEMQTSRLASVVDGLSTLREEVVESAEDSLVEIVLEVVCKTIGNSLANSSTVREILAHSLKRLSGAKVARIRLGSADFGLVSKLAAHELSESLEAVEFIEDETIGSGGCILESDVGTLDCRLETQLSRLREVLLTVRRSHE